MAVVITHTKVSAIADDPVADAAGEVLPSHWNASHSLSGVGTMAEQNANAVAITGGAESGVTHSGDTIGTYLDHTAVAAPSYVEGRTWYDSTAHALAYYNDSATATVHIGQDLQFKVINNTGSSIANGAPVYITSTSSGQTYPNIALAKADAAGTANVAGLTNGSIASGAIGYVTAQGVIDNVNTGAFTVGQVLYLSPYSAGQLMNTVPPTGIAVQVGIVSYVNSSTGKIYVKQTTPLAVSASILTGQVAIANGGTGASTASGARTNLGLGTIAIQDSTSVAITGGSIDGTTVGATTASTGAFTTLSASSTVSGTGFSTYLASPPAIGGTAAAAGTFTTLTAIGQTSLGGAAGAEGLRVLNTASSTAWAQITGSTVSSFIGAIEIASASTVPSSDGIGINYVAQQLAPHTFKTGASKLTQFVVSPTSSVVNYVQVTGGATGTRPAISAQGSDGNVGLTYNAKGSANHFFQTSGLNSFAISNIASQVNYFQVAPSVAGQGLVMSSQGTDTNISQVFQSKGTGAIDLSAGSSGVNISNGGTVTALTVTNQGASYNPSGPTVSISAPTTAGGVQAIATVATMNTSVTPTVISGGTGYTNGDTLTIAGTSATLTVTGVSGGVITSAASGNFVAVPLASIPTNPASVTGGTGSGATFTLLWKPVTLTIGTAGSGYVEQPTVTFSGGGGSGAAAYATVGSGTTVKSIGSTMSFAVPSGNVLQLQDNGSAVPNYLTIKAAGTSQLFPNTTNSDLLLSGNGTGGIRLNTNSTAQQQMAVTHTASAVNYVNVTGAATGGAVSIQSQGSDGNVLIAYATKGTGSHSFYSGGITNRQVRIDGASAAVNYLDFYGSVAGQGVAIKSNGSDTDIPLVLQPKGAGAIDLAAGSSGVNISNGGTVTALTVAGTGGGGYTTLPSVAISAPTTAGGVQATASINANLASPTPTVVSGGTGYTVGDVLTIVGGTFSVVGQLTVATVSSGAATSVTISAFGTYTALPTNPISVTGGTGSSATFNVNWGVRSLNITNAGSGYVEQPTVTFSGGGGSGAAAYATVGSGTIVKSIGATGTQSLDFYTPSSTSYGVPALRIRDTLNDSYSMLQGGSGFTSIVAQGNAGSSMNIASNGSGLLTLNTNGTSLTRQLAVSHTASAVNYVQVTGSITNQGISALPGISIQGSDATTYMGVGVKGTGGYIAFYGANSTNAHVFRINTTNASASGTANFLQVTAGASGSAPSLGVAGTDSNIDLALTPKNTGALVAQASDGGTTINARGIYAVDLQMQRGSASRVASGANAFIGAGYDNAVSGGYSVVAGGYSNASTASQAAVLGGKSNIASGISSVIAGGLSNTSTGYYNFIGGGYTNSGTANAAVTTQSATMNGTTAVTLAATNANIKVGQYITGTSIAGDTYVAAISGTSLTLSQAASGSSTSTLSFYTPHGVVVGGGNNQATGSYSFIGGGGDAGTAANRNAASGAWASVVGGITNVASNSYSFVGGGGNNNSSGVYSTVSGGNFNTANSQSAFVGGGAGNLSNSAYGNIIGGYQGTTRGIVGNTVTPACNAPISATNGITQSGLLILARQTTDATATVLASDSNAASGTNQVILPNNSAYYFRGEVIAGVTGGGNTKGWFIEGVIKRGSGVGTAALVGTPTVTSLYADIGASTWTIGVTADTTNGGLAVTFTGQAATTIRCVAQIRTTEMTF